MSSVLKHSLQSNQSIVETYIKKCSIQTLLNKTFHWILETLSKKAWFFGEGTLPKSKNHFWLYSPIENGQKWPKCLTSLDTKNEKFPYWGEEEERALLMWDKIPFFFTASLSFSDTANHLPVHLFQFTYNLDIFHIQPLSMFSEQINNCADRGHPFKWLVDLWIVTQSKDVKCQCEIAPPWPLLWFYCQCQVVCHSTICKLINF